jgi:hypothetical protein
MTVVLAGSDVYPPPLLSGGAEFDRVRYSKELTRARNVASVKPCIFCITYRDRFVSHVSPLLSGSKRLRWQRWLHSAFSWYSVWPPCLCGKCGGPAPRCLHGSTGDWVAVHQSHYVRPFRSLNVELCVPQDETSVRRYHSIARYFEKLPHVQPGTASGGEWREK